MTDAKIKQLIEPVFRQSLEGSGYEAMDVRSGEDHDGDAALFMKIRFGPDAEMLAGAQANALLAQTREVLLEYGEERFPHLDFVFPTDRDSKRRLEAQARNMLGA